MGKALNVLLGSVATALVTVGVASQTGTVRWPTFSDGVQGGVRAQQATQSPSPSPSPSAEPSPSPSPTPTQAPVEAQPPPPHKKHK
ncbi:MAG TPA: hypothetical protein VGH93_09115 [Solirubrobacteraceae bacterium]|jgi:hypothetical protein